MSQPDPEPFSSWEGYVDPKIITSARALVERARREISAAKNDEGGVRSALQRCVEGFNALNAEHRGFIKTIESEDIAAVVAELARQGGLRDVDDEIVDEWRDW